MTTFRVTTQLPATDRDHVLSLICATLARDPALSPRSRRWLETAMDAGQVHIALAGGEIAGWMFRVEHSAAVQELAGAYVDPGHRLNGAGLALLQAILPLAPVTFCTTGSGWLAAYLERNWAFRPCGLASLVRLTGGRILADRMRPDRLRMGRAYLRRIRLRCLYLAAEPGPCPGCGLTGRSRWWSARDLAFGTGTQCRYVTCTGCGHVRQADGTGELTGFSESQLPFVRKAMSHPWVARSVYAPRARWLAQRLPLTASTRLLDVGCATGDFLQIVEREFGAACQGVEADPGLAESAAQAGVSVTAADFLSYTPDAPFDVVTMFHVLEHVPDPAAALAKALAILKPGGWLCIETPVSDGWAFGVFGRFWFPLLPPFHYHVCSRRSLRAITARAGRNATVRAARSIYLPGEWAASANLPIMGLLPHPHQTRRLPWPVTLAGITLAFIVLTVMAPFEAVSALCHRWLPIAGHQRLLLQKETA